MTRPGPELDKNGNMGYQTDKDHITSNICNNMYAFTDLDRELYQEQADLAETASVWTYERKFLKHEQKISTIMRNAQMLYFIVNSKVMAL